MRLSGRDSNAVRRDFDTHSTAIVSNCSDRLVMACFKRSCDGGLRPLDEPAAKLKGQKYVES